MSGKPKIEIDSDDAYVLDDETLEELDKASLESVTNDLTNTMKRPVVIVEDPEDDDEAGYLVRED
jgi:hypothetical protein